MKKLIILLSFFISFAANAQKVIRITLPKSVTADAYSKSQTDSISTTLRNEITVAANGGVTLSQLDSANNVTKAQIPSNLSQLTNDPGYITASNISGKVNYTDTAAALLPYLRKVDTTGKWISPAVANATYATISNLNLKLDKSDSTIANRVTNLQNTKANDNNVIHQTGNETASSKWLNNSYIALGGELSDLGMTGLFDRNELTNADLRGTVTVTQYTSGAASDVTSLAPAMFDGSGNFSSFIETSGSPDSLKVLIDLGSNVSNYNSGYWQPFVAFRLPYDLFKNIKVEVSTDNSTWTTSNTPASWSFNSTSQVFFPTGYWMGAKDYCANLASTWRYIRFSFKNPSNTDPYVYISEIGMRHSSAPYARQYLLKAGDNIYGTINLMNKSTNMGSINPSTGTFTGIFSGNSTSASKLQTARNINGVPFDGTSNITVTDATKEPTITAGTTSQFWRGDKTWQNISTLPVSTATQTALDAKLDKSFRDVWGAADPFVSDTINKILGMRQSWVDSIRNSRFTAKVLGLDTVSFDNTLLTSTKNIVLRNFGQIYFEGKNNLFQYGWIPMNNYNGGLYSHIEDSNGVDRENIVMTPTGIGIDGVNIPAAKMEFAVSSGADGDAPLMIHDAPLTPTVQDGQIEKNNGKIFISTGTVRKSLAYTSDILATLSDSVANRNYANDSIAVVDGKLSLHKFYRSGSDVKIVSTLPYFAALNYVIDATGVNDSTQFQLHFNTSGLSFSVDWGDGVTDAISGFGAFAIVTHKYTSSGFYNPKLILNVGDAAKILEFIVNNYPYNTRITKVNNLGYLTAATNIDVSVAQALDSTTTDFAFPSTLTQLGLNSCGLTKFTPTHNLPATLNNFNLSFNTLSVNEVNNTLVWLDGQTFNAGTKNLNIHQSVYATPTGAGMTALISLQSKGWVIDYDN